MKSCLFRYRRTTLAFLAVPLFFCLVCPLPYTSAVKAAETQQACPTGHDPSSTTPDKPAQCNPTQPFAISKAATSDLKFAYLLLVFAALSTLTLAHRPVLGSTRFGHLATRPSSHRKHLYLLNRTLLL
jgi:hypothetical protein